MSAIQKKTKSSLVEGKDVLLSEEITIFLLDVSGSMDDSIADDGSFSLLEYPTKFRAMKKAMSKYIHQRMAAIQNGANDHVGVITFGEDVKLIHDPMSNNFDTLGRRVDAMRTGGSTPMAQAIDLAIQTAERFTTGMIRVIICSDGYPDYKYNVIDKVVKGFEELGIIFDTIGVGNKNNYFGLDEEFLKEIAELGGGNYTFISSYQEFTRKFLSLESERQLLLGNGILMLPK